MLFLTDDKVLATLPSAAREKIERADEERAAASAAYVAARQAEDVEREEWSRRYAAVQTQIESGMLSQPDQDRLLEPVKQVAAGLQRRIEARDRAALRQREFAFLDDIERWLNRTARNRVRFRPVTVDAPKSKDPLAEVTKLRARLAEIERLMVRVTRAPAPKAQLYARALQEIDEMAAHGELRINLEKRVSEPLDLASRLSNHFNQSRGFAGFDGLSLFVFLLRDKFKDEVKKLINALPDDEGMDDAERDNAIAALADERLALERQEEALIMLAADRGQHIARRRNIDPRAFLGIAA